jgi:uncharacterized membrane protein
MTEPVVSATVPITGEFRVGHVLASSFSVLFRNLPQFVVLSAIATLPEPILLVATGKGLSDLANVPAFGTRLYYVQVLLNLVLTALCESIVLYGAFQAIRSRPFRISESLSKGLVRFFPVLGTSVLSFIMAGFAALILLVPGLIIMTMFYVASPICVVERLGPLQSLGRSSDLTKGHRWKIFGLAILLVLGLVITSVAIGALLGLLGIPTVLGIGTFLWETLARAFMALVAVVAYHDLRVAKEGVDIDDIAAVFD